MPTTPLITRSMATSTATAGKKIKTGAARVHVGGGAGTKGAADMDVSGPEMDKDTEEMFALLTCSDKIWTEGLIESTWGRHCYN